MGPGGPRHVWAIVLDFFLDHLVTAYLVVATMAAAATVGCGHLILAARRLRQWLVERRNERDIKDA